MGAAPTIVGVTVAVSNTVWPTVGAVGDAVSVVIVVSFGKAVLTSVIVAGVHVKLALPVHVT